MNEGQCYLVIKLSPVNSELWCRAKQHMHQVHMEERAYALQYLLQKKKKKWLRFRNMQAIDLIDEMAERYKNPRANVWIPEFYARVQCLN